MVHVNSMFSLTRHRSVDQVAAFLLIKWSNFEVAVDLLGLDFYSSFLLCFCPDLSSHLFNAVADMYNAL